jgi:predicted RNase H-like HicB family nuclease
MAPRGKEYNPPGGLAMQMIVNLIYDEEYKGYVADVPVLDGCMSQGKTVEKALKNVREAIALYLEATPRKRRPTLREVLTAVVEV